MNTPSATTQYPQSYTSLRCYGHEVPAEHHLPNVQCPAGLKSLALYNPLTDVPLTPSSLPLCIFALVTTAGTCTLAPQHSDPTRDIVQTPLGLAYGTQKTIMTASKCWQIVANAFEGPLERLTLEPSQRIQH